MRAHDHELAESSGPRPETSRVADRNGGARFEAAGAGRSDVLGPQGMLSLQRVVGNARTAALAEDQSPVLAAVSGAGRPLEGPVRQDMESRIGADFSDVRVHTDDLAHASAESVGARAYTSGSNIVFQRDSYDPSSAAGQRMLAHELTHVVQQRNGPVDGTPTGNGVSVSDPSDRFEREAVANADHVMSGAAVQRATLPELDEQEPGLQDGPSPDGLAPDTDEEIDELPA